MSELLTHTPDPSSVDQGTNGSCVILLYHRVTTLTFDPLLLSVTPKHFAEHLDVLSQYKQPISLREMMRRLDAGESLENSVVLSFDDGYADNFLEAAPLLNRYGVPATVFAATGYVGGDREYWWDELERLLFEPRELTSALSMEMGRDDVRIELDDTRNQPVEQVSNWNVTDRDDPTCRHRLYRLLFDLLRPLEHDVREAAISQLAVWCGLDRTVRDSHRPLSIDELRALNRDDLVEIGAHTVTHPVLSKLDAITQAKEISKSKHDLEAILDEPVTSFSYPFGTQHDYNADSLGAVREAGFTMACSNFSALVTPTADRFQLPRMLVRDWDGDTLLCKLAEMSVDAR